MSLPQACCCVLGPSLDKALSREEDTGTKEELRGAGGQETAPAGIVPAAPFCLHPAEGREGPASLGFRRCLATHRACDGQLVAEGPALRDPTVQAP